MLKQLLRLTLLICMLHIQQTQSYYCWLCSSYDNCDDITGYCTKCAPGYWYYHCLSECERTCGDWNGNFPLCELITGHCFSCLNDKYYGETCQTQCSSDCYQSKCHQASGECLSCHLTKWGSYCNYTCPLHCLDSICDISTGECLACEDGFNGKFCNQASKRLIASSRIQNAVIVGGVLGSLVLVGAISGVVYHMKKHKRARVDTQKVEEEATEVRSEADYAEENYADEDYADKDDADEDYADEDYADEDFTEEEKQV